MHQQQTGGGKTGSNDKLTTLWPAVALRCHRWLWSVCQGSHHANSLLVFDAALLTYHLRGAVGREVVTGGEEKNANTVVQVEMED